MSFAYLIQSKISPTFKPPKRNNILNTTPVLSLLNRINASISYLPKKKLSQHLDIHRYPSRILSKLCSEVKPNDKSFFLFFLTLNYHTTQIEIFTNAYGEKNFSHKVVKKQIIRDYES